MNLGLDGGSVDHGSLNRRPSPSWAGLFYLVWIGACVFISHMNWRLDSFVLPVVVLFDPHSVSHMYILYYQSVSFVNLDIMQHVIYMCPDIILPLPSSLTLSLSLSPYIPLSPG